MSSIVSVLKSTLTGISRLATNRDSARAFVGVSRYPVEKMLEHAKKALAAFERERRAGMKEELIALCEPFASEIQHYMKELQAKLDTPVMKERAPRALPMDPRLIKGIRFPQRTRKI